MTIHFAQHRHALAFGLGSVATVVVFALVFQIFSLHHAGMVSDTTPNGWHRSDPPQVGQQTSYAISQDVPGLALALTGDFTGSRSTDMPLAGILWRTRDSGAHWEKLINHPTFPTGTNMAMVRDGKGTLIATTNTGAYLSSNAGTNWQLLHLSQAQQDSNGQFFQRNSTLYLFILNQFWRSNDMGQTWQVVFQNVTDPHLITSVAPDYRANGAWYRVVQYVTDAPNVQSTGTPVTQLDHSVDDGRTWQMAQTIVVPPGMHTLIGNLSAVLATNPTLPGRFCIALDIGDYSLAHANTTALMSALHQSVPFPGPPHRLLLTANTANSPAQQTIGIAQDFAGYGKLAGVTLDAQGTCRTVIAPQPFASNRTNSEAWSIAFGDVPGITAVRSQTIEDMTVIQSAFTLNGGERRLTVAAFASHGLITCHNNDPCPNRFAYPTHLMWRDLP